MIEAAELRLAGKQKLVTCSERLISNLRRVCSVRKGECINGALAVRRDDLAQYSTRFAQFSRNI